MALSRVEWLRTWGYQDGTPEAAAAWNDKQAFVARQADFQVMGDTIDPLVSQADGKTYDSKSALYRSYRADGNPQGIAYECVGNEPVKPFERPKRDRDKAMQAVKRTLDEMGI